MKKSVFILILCTLLFFSGCTVKKEKQPTSKQISPEERIASIKQLQSSNAYSNSIVENTDSFFYITNSGIEKADKDFENGDIIVESSEIKTLYLYNDKLYYSTDSDISCYDVKNGISQQVYSIAPDDTVGGLRVFFVDGEKIYLRIGKSTIFEFDLTTKTDKLFLEDSLAFDIINNTIYYIDCIYKTFSIYRIDSNGRTDTVRGDALGKYDKSEMAERYDGLVSVGDTLYYSMRSPRYRIYRYSEHGNDEIIADTDGDSTLELGKAGKNNNFYYAVHNQKQDGGYSSVIFEYSEESGSRELMRCDQNIYKFTVTGSYIFYKVNAKDSSIKVYPLID